MTSESDTAGEVTDLRRRVITLENRLDTESRETATGDAERTRDDTGSGRIDTELLYETLDACMSSERITEDEEIRVLGHLLD
jgi:hypothetical protein